MGLGCTAYKNLRVMPENEVIYNEYKDENDVVVERYAKNALELYVSE